MNLQHVSNPIAPPALTGADPARSRAAHDRARGTSRAVDSAAQMHPDHDASLVLIGLEEIARQQELVLWLLESELLERCLP